MVTAFTIALYVATAIIVFNMLWSWSPKNSGKLKRPFMAAEWISLLIYAGYCFGLAQNKGFYFLFVAIGLLGSWWSYKRWQRWLEVKATQGEPSPE